VFSLSFIAILVCVLYLYAYTYHLLECVFSLLFIAILVYVFSLCIYLPSSWRYSFSHLIGLLAIIIDRLYINLLGTAELCAELFLCTAEFNANYVEMIRHCNM